MKKEVKTNLRWPGGKSKMMKILDEYLPLKVNKYLETFTGGGSVLLYIIQKYHPKKIYANDIDQYLINYYESVKNDPQKVIDECMETRAKYNAEEFREGFKLIDRSTASGFFTANKTSFSGLNHNYSVQAYDRNFSESTILKINDLSDVIKDTTFINGNFLELDNNIDEPIEGFFIYLDPPYYGNRNVGLYGKKGLLHKEFDHDAMFEWVMKHKDDNEIMISYDDSEHIREMYKDFYIYDFDFTYSMTNVGGNKCKEGKEIVITNYDVDLKNEAIYGIRLF